MLQYFSKKITATTGPAGKSRMAALTKNSEMMTSIKKDGMAALSKKKRQARREFFIEHLLGSAEVKELVDEFLEIVEQYATVFLVARNLEQGGSEKSGTSTASYDAQHHNKFIVRELLRVLTNRHEGKSLVDDETDREEVIDLIFDCMQTDVDALLTPQEHVYIDRIDDGLIELFTKLGNLRRLDPPFTLP